MFYSLGGKEVVIQDGFIGHLPPMPDKRLVIGHNVSRSEQYWKRQEIPDHFHKLFKEENERQREDEILVRQGKKSKVFIDQVLEQYRRQEWWRRRHGLWFANDGDPVYLTGDHYWYLQWSQYDHKINNGYPLYYEFSRDNFYFRKWCEENPFSLGYLMIASRGTGKSNEEIAVVTNRATYFHKHHVAIQGKHIDDSKEFIEKKIVPLFNALPGFFKPEYSHGTNAQNELVFTRKSTSGKAASEMEFGPEQELGSSIYAAQPGEKVLDRSTLGDVLNTEVGKTDKAVADVYERMLVQQKTVVRNHIKVGIIRNESTVEEMDKGGRECEKMFKNSDHRVLDDNGWTRSKLHRRFISALDTDTSTISFKSKGIQYDAPCNKNGKVSRMLANIKIQADLDGVKHDLKELSARMRKSPRNETEAFIPDQSKSIFNVQALTTRLHQIRHEMKEPPYVRGNFYWLNERFGQVWFKPDAHAGRFNVAWFPDEYHQGIKEPGKNKIINNFTKEWGYNIRTGKAQMLVMPGNDHLFRAGTDPIKYVFTKDARASKAAIHVFRMFDGMIDGGGKPVSKWQSHNFIVEYCERPDNPDTYLEDMAMVSMFLGCKVFPERNVPDVNKFFEQNGLQNLLSYPKEWIQYDPDLILPTSKVNETDAGLAASKLVIDFYTKQIIPYINEHISRCPFDNTVEDWLKFDPLNPTTSHMTVSSGYALMHATKKSEQEEKPPGDKISDWFDEADNSGISGVLIDRDN